jgi:hypothetical protein
MKPFASLHNTHSHSDVSSRLLRMLDAGIRNLAWTKFPFFQTGSTRHKLNEKVLRTKLLAEKVGSFTILSPFLSFYLSLLSIPFTLECVSSLIFFLQTSLL